MQRHRPPRAGRNGTMARHNGPTNGGAPRTGNIGSIPKARSGSQGNPIGAGGLNDHSEDTRQTNYDTFLPDLPPKDMSSLGGGQSPIGVGSSDRLQTGESGVFPSKQAVTGVT